MPIMLTAGELIGSSPKLSQMLSDHIRVKTMKESEIPATVHHVKEINVRQNLLQLLISIHGKTFEAVVDTGSEINVMKYSIWHDWAKVPMNVTASMHLTDVNGGISQLHGLVPEMTFQIGIVDCKTSFWISDNCPPEILLGHPWQIEKNKVTITKKNDGT